MSTTVWPLSMSMKIPAFGARAAKAPLEPLKIEPRNPSSLDIEIEILYCGICHSDVHKVNDDWGGTHFPVVPGMRLSACRITPCDRNALPGGRPRRRGLHRRFMSLVPRGPGRPRDVLRNVRHVHGRQLQPQHENVDVRRLLHEDRRR